MTKYKVTFKLYETTETLGHVFVDADNKDQAEQIAQEKYDATEVEWEDNPIDIGFVDCQLVNVKEATDDIN